MSRLRVFLGCHLFLFCFGCYSQKKQSDLSALLSLATSIPVSIIGDSLCERSQAFDLADGLGPGFQVLNVCITGSTVPDWSQKLDTALTNTPRIVIIELGTNDVSSYPTNQFPGNYDKLISDLSVRTNAVLLVTVLPPPADPGFRTGVLTINKYLKGLSASHSIADMETPFLQQENSIPLYPQSDPIHPDPAGIAIMKSVYIQAIGRITGLPL
ncbi:SGNH/GDSL hydrolase family protein [Leptospira fluminis]|uniref:SGNH/GDSL hydrolase family protein n=1 Tax=Leptospira fluminis TaxID=2484979 RepID=A0A4R9GNM7_9LEPT|nr:SGNH/GDSL hydrolase family protein [Leptospira fluminis]TGK17938.1 SGNH/GDSL hydrolase family protein [Leptospira fluminis]